MVKHASHYLGTPVLGSAVQRGVSVLGVDIGEESVFSAYICDTVYIQYIVCIRYIYSVYNILYTLCIYSI